MKRLFLLFGLLLFTGVLSAERKDLLINDHWMFRFSHQVQRGSAQLVHLPHTWNALDTDSRSDYYRGLGVYTKELWIDPNWRGKRLFLRFEGGIVRDVNKFCCVAGFEKLRPRRLLLVAIHCRITDEERRRFTSRYR